MKKTTLWMALLAISGSALVGCSNDEDVLPGNENYVSTLPDEEEVPDAQDFFATELKGCNRYNTLFDLPRAEGDGSFAVAYRVIDSAEELASVYKGERALPEIDFAVNSLLLGYVVLPDGRYALDKAALEEAGESLLLEVYVQMPHRAGIASQTDEAFWGLYPKLSGKKAVVNVKVEQNRDTRIDAYTFVAAEDGTVRPEGVQPLSAEDFLRSIVGSGWRYDGGHAIGSDGKVAEDDVYYDVLGGSPEKYYFDKEEVTTFFWASGLPADCYARAAYRYDAATNGIEIGNGHRMTVLALEGDDLALMDVYQPEHASYSTYSLLFYRRMTSEELEQTRQRYNKTYEEAEKEIYGD